MDAAVERSTLGAQRVLVVPGRLWRLSLPLREPPLPETDPCFLCRDDDPWSRGSLEGAGEWWVWGNAFPVAQEASILALRGPSGHDGTLADLGEEAWGAVLASVQDPRACPPAERSTAGLRRVFANQGRIAGQTRRHPHLQWIRFVGAEDGGEERRAVEQDRERAEDEGRSIARSSSKAPIVWVPARPAQSAELWLSMADLGDEAGRWLARCLRACERTISTSYNVVILPELDLVRVVPRGLGERAGLELALAGLLDAVVVCSSQEAAALWTEALGSV